MSEIMSKNVPIAHFQKSHTSSQTHTPSFTHWFLRSVFIWSMHELGSAAVPLQKYFSFPRYVPRYSHLITTAPPVEPFTSNVSTPPVNQTKYLLCSLKIYKNTSNPHINHRSCPCVIAHYDFRWIPHNAWYLDPIILQCLCLHCFTWNLISNKRKI